VVPLDRASPSTRSTAPPTRCPSTNDPPGRRRPTHYGDTVTLADDLLADGDPEAEFHPGVADRMPSKIVAAGALIRDDLGRILLVEPVYKPTWDIPGGVVETNETPLDACRRELREELGVDLPLSRLLVIDWVPQQGASHDALLFIFDGGILAPDQAARITLQQDELTSARFLTLPEATDRIRPSAARRLAAALDAARSSDGPRYLQFGRPTLPT
jgi:ADP-ribose pyrophosphatase YjhB (NUDIX family)